MKSLLVSILLLVTMISAQPEDQNDIIEFKNGKKIETKITAHTRSTVTTDAGIFKIKRIKLIRFFTKNYDDLEFYTQLETAGVEFRFTTTPQ